MSIIKDLSEAEINHLYDFARTNFQQAREAGVRNPEGISLLTDSGTIIWGGSHNQEGFTAADDLLKLRAELSPHEQFQMAVIATGYDHHAHRTKPASHEMLSTLQKIRNGAPLFVKVIAAEERASHAFILS
ncbi:MAG: hypothetical protein WC043_09830 [Pseudobdellovibrionaceae bacterium]